MLIAAANCVPAYAAESKLAANDIVNAIHTYNIKEDKELRAVGETSYVGTRIPEVDVSKLPSKFDLRDVNGKNYVSPVKDQ